MVVVVVLAAALVGVAIVPCLVSFLRPSWIRAIVVFGAIVALTLWIPSWFGELAGDADRAAVVLITGVWAIVVLGLWLLGASTGLRFRRRRTARQPRTRPA